MPDPISVDDYLKSLGIATGGTAAPAKPAAAPPPPPPTGWVEVMPGIAYNPNFSLDKAGTGTMVRYFGPDIGWTTPTKATPDVISAARGVQSSGTPQGASPSAAGATLTPAATPSRTPTATTTMQTPANRAGNSTAFQVPSGYIPGPSGFDLQTPIGPAFQAYDINTAGGPLVGNTPGVTHLGDMSNGISVSRILADTYGNGRPWTSGDAATDAVMAANVERARNPSAAPATPPALGDPLAARPSMAASPPAATGNLALWAQGLINGLQNAYATANAPATPAPAPAPVPAPVGQAFTPSPASTLAPDRQAFVDAMYPVAEVWSQKTGIPPEVYLAINGSESNFGKATSLFGVKGEGNAGSNTYDTHEVVNGQNVPQTDKFANYSDPNAAYQGFHDFLANNSRYAPALAQYQQDHDSAALLQNINKAGYATDPNWANMIMGMANDIKPNLPNAVTGEVGQGFTPPTPNMWQQMINGTNAITPMAPVTPTLPPVPAAALTGVGAGLATATPPSTTTMKTPPPPDYSGTTGLNYGSTGLFQSPLSGGLENVFRTDSGYVFSPGRINETESLRSPMGGFTPLMTPQGVVIQTPLDATPAAQVQAAKAAGLPDIGQTSNPGAAYAAAQFGGASNTNNQNLGFASAANLPPAATMASVAQQEAAAQAAQDKAAQDAAAAAAGGMMGDNGGTRFMATGGTFITTKPTVFPMANGGRAVTSEYGQPEMEHFDPMSGGRARVTVMPMKGYAQGGTFTAGFPNGGYVAQEPPRGIGGITGGGPSINLSLPVGDVAGGPNGLSSPGGNWQNQVTYDNSATPQFRPPDNRIAQLQRTVAEMQQNVHNYNAAKAGTGGPGVPALNGARPARMFAKGGTFTTPDPLAAPDSTANPDVQPIANDPGYSLNKGITAPPPDPTPAPTPAPEPAPTPAPIETPPPPTPLTKGVDPNGDVNLPPTIGPTAPGPTVSPTTPTVTPDPTPYVPPLYPGGPPSTPYIYSTPPTKGVGNPTDPTEPPTQVNLPPTVTPPPAGPTYTPPTSPPPVQTTPTGPSSMPTVDPLSPGNGVAPHGSVTPPTTVTTPATPDTSVPAPTTGTPPPITAPLAPSTTSPTLTLPSEAELDAYRLQRAQQERLRANTAYQFGKAGLSAPTEIQGPTMPTAVNNRPGFYYNTPDYAAQLEATKTQLGSLGPVQDQNQVVQQIAGVDTRIQNYQNLQSQLSSAQQKLSSLPPTRDLTTVQSDIFNTENAIANLQAAAAAPPGSPLNPYGTDPNILLQQMGQLQQQLENAKLEEQRAVTVQQLQSEIANYQPQIAQGADQYNQDLQAKLLLNNELSKAQQANSLIQTANYYGKQIDPMAWNAPPTIGTGPTGPTVMPPPWISPYPAP